MIYSDNSLTSYLQLIKNIPLLTRSEEREIANEIKVGNLKAKQKLVVSNLKFVIQIAKKYKNANIPLLDLVSEGNLGLMKAAENFDVSKGVNFISYAVHWIKQSILKAIAEKSNAMRIPLDWNNNLSRIHKKKNEMNANKLNQKNIDKMADELDLKSKKINELIKISNPCISINQKFNQKGGDEKKNEMENFIPHKDSLEENFLNKNLKKDIDATLKELKPIEADIIRSRFGLNDRETKTLLEIGNQYNLSKERIRQIQKSTLGILKKIMKKKNINSYLAA